jgi:hypothetical protein
MWGENTDRYEAHRPTYISVLNPEGTLSCGKSDFLNAVMNRTIKMGRGWC